MEVGIQIKPTTMKKIIITVLLCLPLLTLQARTINAPLLTVQEYSVQELAKYFADYYGADYRDFYSTGWCESGWNPEAQGDGKRANNVLQIHRPTFNQWAKEMGEELDYNSTYDHIKVGAWAFAQGESYRRAWTAYRALENGGTYSFYSKLLDKHFTVHCNYIVK